MPPLTKQNLNINFGQGLDTKTDPWQVKPGKMLALQNAIFTKGGLLQKRNGFGALTAISDSTVKTLSTFQGSLTAIGSSLYDYSSDTGTWYNKGAITPLRLGVDPLVRSALSLTQPDVAISSNGVTCVVYNDSTGQFQYQVLDGTSKQVIVPPVNLPATTHSPRVFALGRYFIITYLATVSAATHLQYIAIPIQTPSSPGAAVDLATDVAALTSGYDGCVTNNSLYFSWSASGPNVKVSFIDQTLLQHNTVILGGGRTGKFISVTADTTTPTSTIWVSLFDNTNNNLYAAALSTILVSILAPTVLINSAGIDQITGAASGGVFTCLYETSSAYNYAAITSDFVTSVTCTSGGSVGSATVIVRGVALASKAFVVNNIKYVLVAYGGSLQPTFFLANSTGGIVAKLAYSNGGGYPASFVLSGTNVEGTKAQIAYVLKDLITPVNKTQGVTNVAGIYSQTGINLVTIDFNTIPLITAEIGNNLHTSGGFMWMYDGAKPVEHSFHLWPEDILATPSGSGGSMSAQQYYYQVCYEWTDAQGNIHRGAPSIPVGALTTTSSSSVVLNIPTLRLTYKTTNKVRIVIYRWSATSQNYYQVTSVSSPTLNNPTVDSIAYTDTLADASIVGNQLLYTTGGIVENIAAPACNDINLYKSRLFLVDAEDENLLWYSKPVIETTPVEMSDLFTIYVAPTTGVQGSSGPTKVIAPLDDKNIFFKTGAIYYNTGDGPDLTGANGGFTDPVFITSTVGCENPRSVVFQPMGLMFQAASGKGIWLLSRNLETSYIGAGVEEFNSANVLSAVNVPGTNQVRFTLDNGVTLMYDYYYDQWGTFVNVPALSSTIYQNLHTFLNSSGQVYQETPGIFLDGTSPVLMSFTTSWFSLMGLQGYHRAYMFYLLGQYYSPHKIQIGVAYDFNSAVVQQALITPDNYNAAYGSDAGLYGSNLYGGNSAVEHWRVFLSKQKCESFQLTVSEIFDASIGAPAGAGFTLSGINLVIGAKKGYSPIKASRSTAAS